MVCLFLSTYKIWPSGAPAGKQPQKQTILLEEPGVSQSERALYEPAPSVSEALTAGTRWRYLWTHLLPVPLHCLLPHLNNVEIFFFFFFFLHHIMLSLFQLAHYAARTLPLRWYLACKGRRLRNAARRAGWRKKTRFDKDASRCSKFNLGPAPSRMSWLGLVLVGDSGAGV